MTRQCAWCQCFLDGRSGEPCITHGICEGCARRLRQSMHQPPSSTPALLFRATKTALQKVFLVR